MFSVKEFRLKHLVGAVNHWETTTMGMCPALCTEIEKEESKCSRIYAYQKQKSIPQSAPEELPFGIEYMVERKEYFLSKLCNGQIYTQVARINWMATIFEEKVVTASENGGPSVQKFCDMTWGPNSLSIKQQHVQQSIRKSKIISRYCSVLSDWELSKWELPSLLSPHKTETIRDIALTYLCGRFNGSLWKQYN